MLHTFPETCEIYARKPVVTAEVAGKRRVNDNRAEYVVSSCLVEPLDKEEAVKITGVVADGLQAVIYLPFGTKVKPGDSIKVTSGQFQGVWFTARSVDSYAYALPHVEVGCEQEKGV
ncbi:MAG: hypothetical protein KatS3mg023_3833 [Armatimonadota bacterium]|jgi:hypothetical protein|nr:MAG: hypothetical protein KatS3mg023_3833 [Armatimonadota bacterium]